MLRVIACPQCYAQRCRRVIPANAGIQYQNKYLESLAELGQAHFSPGRSAPAEPGHGNDRMEKSCQENKKLPDNSMNPDEISGSKIKNFIITFRLVQFSRFHFEMHSFELTSP